MCAQMTPSPRETLFVCSICAEMEPVNFQGLCPRESFGLLHFVHLRSNLLVGFIHFNELLFVVLPASTVDQLAAFAPTPRHLYSLLVLLFDQLSIRLLLLVVSRLIDQNGPHSIHCYSRHLLGPRCGRQQHRFLLLKCHALLLQLPVASCRSGAEVLHRFATTNLGIETL